MHYVLDNIPNQLLIEYLPPMCSLLAQCIKCLLCYTCWRCQAAWSRCVGTAIPHFSSAYESHISVHCRNCTWWNRQARSLFSTLWSCNNINAYTNDVGTIINNCFDKISPSLVIRVAVYCNIFIFVD